MIDGSPFGREAELESTFFYLFKDVIGVVIDNGGVVVMPVLHAKTPQVPGLTFGDLLRYQIVSGIDFFLLCAFLFDVALVEDAC